MLLRLFAIVFACVIWGVQPALGYAASPFAGSAPNNLGLQDGHLAACPSTPNCVVSQGTDPDHQIAAIPYGGDRQKTYDTLVQVLSVVPRTTIIEQNANYIRAESRSRLMGFVDDVEFYLPTDQAVIHLRSASRLGESDLGVNRRRLEQIRLALKDLGITARSENSY